MGLKPRPADKNPMTDGDLPQLESLLAARMDAAIHRLRLIAGTASVSTLDHMFELDWFDIDKWRSSEAEKFWFYSYLLAICFGEAHHAKRLRRLPKRDVYSAAHKQIDATRAFCAEVIERRAAKHPVPDDGADKLPRGKDAITKEIGARISDRRWQPIRDVVALVSKPKFSLESLDGLRVYAALLVFGTTAQLKSLAPVARKSPPLKLVLEAATVIDRPKPTQTGDGLLELVYQQPFNDEPRAVYADWLIEQADSRGEFIQAQLAGADARPDDEQAVAWSGVIELLEARSSLPRVMTTPRYRRGFLSGARVGALKGPLAGSPAWSTVEVLDVAGISAIADYHLPSLIALGSLYKKTDLVTLSKQSNLCRQLAAVGFYGETSNQVLDQLSKVTSLKLLLLRKRGKADLDHPLFDRLDMVVFDSNCRIPKELEARVKCVKAKNSGCCLPHYDMIVSRH